MKTQQTQHDSGGEVVTPNMPPAAQTPSQSRFPLLNPRQPAHQPKAPGGKDLRQVPRGSTHTLRGVKHGRQPHPANQPDSQPAN
ncbi:hypothetical protein Pmani_006409 [Petrolisthes manimaculis]|uniref:Uncharacterized protein n=1 Tax=Petrolisthes manimaculis TaxID=1843537 RepID=A0AAE1UJL9_9EUCA|nr:hypothetical protein Pmani_006409 [Petrolisthes manimaculis]